MQKIFPINIEQAIFPAIEVFDNPGGNNGPAIQIVDPEFSCVCPKTGLPDYATVILEYIPQKFCVELKSWKLYLRHFYGVGSFHEKSTAMIANAFVEAVKPLYMSIFMKWGARGGLHTTTCMSFENGKWEVMPHVFASQVFVEADHWANR